MSSRNKKRRSKSLRAVAVVYFAVIFASPLTAASSTGTLAVSATILDTCIVVVSPLAFPNPNTSTATNDNGTSAVTISCTATKSNVNITLNAGLNFADSVRQMKSGSNLLPYVIYKDSGRTSAVGNGDTLNDDDIVALTPSIISIYGQIPAASKPAGVYSDTVTITVNY